MWEELTVMRFLGTPRRGKIWPVLFEQRLFFAGEATHVHDYSTAHGAPMTAAFGPQKKRSQPWHRSPV
jgi:hypothetical protein